MEVCKVAPALGPDLEFVGGLETAVAKHQF